jgi:peptidoglycan/LPS O-acetylase OafA/YrhL
MQRLAYMVESVRREESGLSKLETVGLIAFVFSLLAMVPPVREFAVTAVGTVFGQIDEETGHINDFSVATRGIAVAVAAVAVFIGSGWLVLWTDVGKRLAFLLTGTATFGWLVINGILFVVYAPRGIQPVNLEGLNAVQMRLPSIAMTLGAFVLFLMFTVALTRYEADVED